MSLSRSRLIFDEKVLALLHDAFVNSPLAGDARLEALQACMEKLPERQRKLVAHRYESGLSIADLARTLGETATCLTTRLHRIRRDLARCVQSRLASEAPQ